MKTFWRLLRMHRPQAGWLLLGLLLSLLTLLANVVLMATSGWFIAAMGLAGVAGITMNYFTPAAIIRACAIVRTTGRYGERLVTHDATLRTLSHLRVWLYEVLEPLSPAGLWQKQSSRLLSRFTADIDTLDNFYLRILLPMAVALLALLPFSAWLWMEAPRLALVEAALLLAAGQALVTLCAWLALWLMLVLVAPEVRSGARPPAELAMFVLFALASFETAAPLPLAFQSLGPTLAAARRLFELADRPPPVPEPAAAPPQTDDTGYRFEGVSFRYPGSEPVLEEIDLDIPPGSRTAIVGPTGSGKSTLVQLMTRFRLPSEGRLYFGGIDLEAWPGESLRRRLAVVEQQGHLFTGTLRQNLLLARPDASEEALRQACRTAQLSAWIDSLPDGLDTEIGEAALRQGHII